MSCRVCDHDVCAECAKREGRPLSRADAGGALGSLASSVENSVSAPPTAAAARAAADDSPAELREIVIDTGGAAPGTTDAERARARAQQERDEHLAELVAELVPSIANIIPPPPGSEEGAPAGTEDWAAAVTAQAITEIRERAAHASATAAQPARNEQSSPAGPR